MNVIAIAAGGYHSMALRDDGTVVAWGAGTSTIYYGNLPDYKQCVVPTNLAGVSAIAAGGFHSLALRTNGTVVAWGWNQYGQTNVPAGLTNVIAVAAGSAHSMALKADGTVVVWGNDTYGQTNGNPSATNVVAIASGNYHCLALRNDGTVVTWGEIVGSVPSYSNFVAIAAGGNHNIAVRTNCNLVAWGDTSYGESTLPAGIYTATNVAAGWMHNLALLSDGSLAISSQPRNRAGYVGGSASFQVVTIYPPSNPSYYYPLRYQWQFNGTSIAGATSWSLLLTNLQFTNAGSYRVLLATNLYYDSPAYSVTSAPASLTVRIAAATTNLAQAVDASQGVWSGTGNASWFGETNITQDGVIAAQSGAIGDSQQSTLQTSLVGPGTLSFWWKVSSEQWFDYLSFFLGGVQQAGISGEVAWEQMTFRLPAGTNNLAWTYSKDPTLSVGLDAGWLGDVVFTPDPPQIVSSDGFFGFVNNQFGFNLSVAAGQTVVVDGSADSGELDSALHQYSRGYPVLLLRSGLDQFSVAFLPGQAEVK